MTSWICLLFAATVVALSLGVSWGVDIAEKSAVLRSDCSTAHHMRGGFYYIVPEAEYVKLIMLRHAKDNGGPTMSAPEPVGRPMTPSEIEDLTVDRVNAGAVGRNAVQCRCGRVIDHFPNNALMSNCLIEIPSCDWCAGRAEEGGES